MITPLHAALADLKAKRDKLDAAIVAIEELLGVAPVATARRPPRQAKPPATPNGNGAAAPLEETVLAHLKSHGWTRPCDLADAVTVAPHALRLQLKTLLKAKRVIAIGKTNTRRLALAGTPPPKEAP